MSNTKTVVILIVLIILAILGWLWYGATNKVAAPVSPATENTISADAGLPTAATDTSNTAIQSDLQSVDAQLQGLHTDTTNIDQSMNQTQ